MASAPAVVMHRSPGPSDLAEHCGHTEDTCRPAETPNATPKSYVSPTKHRYLFSFYLKDEFTGYLGEDKSFPHAEVLVDLANFSNAAGLFETFASQRLQGNSGSPGLFWSQQAASKA